MAKTDFVLQAEERLIFEGKLNKMNSKITASEGTCYLTTKRLVRYQANTLLKATIGLLAMLFKQKHDFTIPLDEIVSLRRKESGIGKKHGFTLKTIDGTELDLVCFSLDQLLAAFQEAFDQHPTLTLSQLGQSEWQVQGAKQEMA